MKLGQEGTKLFENTWKAPADWAAGNVDVDWVVSSLEDRVGVLWVRETKQYYGFSLETGEYLWTTEPEHYLNQYASSRCGIAYGRLFAVGYSGVTYCYNITTGERLWTYEAEDPNQEMLWANNWPLYMGFITDGKIYLHATEHSAIDPKPRGAPFICLDVETGELVFKANIRGHHWGESPIIGDSIMVMYNTYDQRIYAIGKGPSATTVSIQNDVIKHGSSVMIKGTVTDVSPGTEDTALQLRFSNGVPVVADDDMSEWMQYVYMQFERPADATGVPVTLEAIDPNGNYVNIGTATTDASGNYGFTFEPEVPGQYMILATFYGSDSYYASTTTTYLTVDPAPSPAGPIEAEESAAPLITTEVAIVLAVAVVAVIGVVGYLVIKKRK